MRATHLSLVDYRNYETAELSLLPGPNLLLGRNGQGKTNLVEAIAYFSTLHSHRVTSDKALVRAGSAAAILRLRIEASQRSALLELQINQDRPNRAQVNRNASRPRELTRWFSAVLFAPEDLGIVRGDPAGRRRFLDDALVLRAPAMTGVLADYERVVRQRTSLLKSGRAAGGSAALEATLSVWDEQLIDLGASIMLARRRLLAEIDAPLRAGYAALVGQDHGPRLGLHESVMSDGVSRETETVHAAEEVSRETLVSAFREALLRVRSKEIERAVTLIGPHRDDAILTLNGLPVKGYASHGESWSFALSLRLALATMLRDVSVAGDPVVILDDVFAELDMTRRRRLMSAVSDFEQVIVTAAVADDVPGDVTWHRVGIEAGTIVDAERVTASGGSEEP